jgi:hypothetical protein
MRATFTSWTAVGMRRADNCLLATTMVALTLAMSACSAATAAPARPPSAIPAPTDTSLVRPVTEEESDLLYRAEMTLVRDCMTQHGFEYYVVPRNPVPELHEFPYVLDDVQWARRYGYGTALRRRADQAMRNDPNERYFESLTPPQQARARMTRNGDVTSGDLLVEVPGVPSVTGSSTGCAAAAQRALYRDLPMWFRARAVSDSLASMRRGAVIGDPRFIAAVANWSRCMLQSGYSFPAPTDARASVTQPPDQIGPQVLASDEAGPVETRLAVTEATCAIDTGLADAAREIDRHYADMLQAQYQADVAAKLRLDLDAVPRARAIVAAG